MTSPTPASGAVEALKAHAGVTMLLGFALILLGVLALFSPLAAGVAVTVFVGSLLLVAGVVRIVFALRSGNGLPSLLLGILALVAGLLLGRPGHEALVPSAWIADSVGGNSPGANLFASVAGAFMYFATLTEVPILEGLLGAGMGKGPALALLLAGPAVSLPSLLVIRSVIGTRKTVVFTFLVMVMATFTGWVYGSVWG